MLKICSLVQYFSWCFECFSHIRPLCQNIRRYILYRLRDHINHRIFLQFTPVKVSIVPINNRPDLHIYLHYRYMPGILKNKPLTTELAYHGAFCHSAISTITIRKYYNEMHSQFLSYGAHCRTQVRDLANLGIDSWIYVLYNTICRDVRTHQCGVLFQINILIVQIYNPAHFPCMPVMMKGLADPDHARIPAPCDIALSTIQIDVIAQPDPMEIE